MLAPKGDRGSSSTHDRNYYSEGKEPHTLKAPPRGASHNRGGGREKKGLKEGKEKKYFRVVEESTNRFRKDYALGVCRVNRINFSAMRTEKKKLGTQKVGILYQSERETTGVLKGLGKRMGKESRRACTPLWVSG